MRTAYHEQLDALTNQLGEMCGLAGVAMERATQALLQADLVLAELTSNRQRRDAGKRQVRMAEGQFVLFVGQILDKLAIRPPTRRARRFRPRRVFRVEAAARGVGDPQIVAHGLDEADFDHAALAGLAVRRPAIRSSIRPVSGA